MKYIIALLVASVAAIKIDKKFATGMNGDEDLG